MIRQRVVRHPGAAWVAALAAAWLVAVACRTMQATVAATPPATDVVRADSDPVSSVLEPRIRVGLLVGVERLSIDVASGLIVHGRAPGETAVRLRTLPRATFEAGMGAGRLRLVETGDELELATVAPARPDELLRTDASPYRGILEVRPTDEGKLTAVNIVHLEDYLRGVVPNELSPEAFPEIEALKAQAVAARSYALAHLGDWSSKGYDVCATPSCQVYRGRSSEHPLTDRAVAETAGVVATWRGRPINAYYTSTCGGHTEEGEAIFEDAAPYLRGVACLPERSSRHTVRTTAAPTRGLPGGGETAHDLALLQSLGVIDAAEADPARLAGFPAEGEIAAWVARLQAVLHRAGPLSPEGAPPDDTLRPRFALTRAETFARLAGAAQEGKAPAVQEGELAGVSEGQLSVLHGEAADSHPLDPAVRLFRDRNGVHADVTELSLAVGDRVVYVEREGRVVYLEAEEGRHGVAADTGSRYYNWEVRLTPAEVAKAITRYGSVGRVRDIVPTRLGVSGRVVELSVLGSQGQLDLKGLRVRWGLGLRENLFVVERETGARGEVEHFVITGKGWGHGVGLCQVGAFGMAQAGSSFEEILKHYYTGVSLTGRPAAAAGLPLAAAAVFDTRRPGS